MDADDARDIVRLATRAPSIYNTQPWRWRATNRVFDLYADRSRELPNVDPTGRQLAVSCGSALFFARVALGAAGWAHRVEELPDPTDHDHLARLTLLDRAEPGRADLAFRDAIERRTTVRERFTERRLPADLRGQLAAEATAEGAWLRWIESVADHTETAVLVNRATRIEQADPAYRSELRHWRRGSDGEAAGDGIGAAALPRERPDQCSSDILLRDFGLTDGPPPGGAGTLMRVPLPAERPDLVVIGTDYEGPASWLVAGQAIGRILLRVTLAGAVASPITQVLDLPWTREQLRSRLHLVGYAQLLLRVGYASAALPVTPRRPVDDVLEIDAAV